MTSGSAAGGEEVTRNIFSVYSCPFFNDAHCVLSLSHVNIDTRTIRDEEKGPATPRRGRPLLMGPLQIVQDSKEEETSSRGAWRRSYRGNWRREQRLRETEEQKLTKAKEMEKLNEKEEILSSFFFVFSFAFSSLWLYSNTECIVLGVVVG